MKLTPALLLPLWISLTMVTGGQEPQPAGKKAEPKAAPTTPPALLARPAKKGRNAPTSSLDSLFRLLEVGRTHEGVHYPVMESGIMTSLVVSARMTRQDENLMELEDAVIDQRGADAIKFYLQRATFNRQTDQLLSGQPTRIEGKSYEIEGDSMSYDRKNSVARLDGRVRMIVYGKPDAPAKDKDKEAKAPAPPTPGGNGGNAAQKPAAAAPTKATEPVK